MRKLIVNMFVSMDGVMQSPGGPDEDPSRGFDLGGWAAIEWDDIMNNTIGGIMGKPFDLLLGRRTYEVFAAHWPYSKEEGADALNNAHKYVVTNNPLQIEWQPNTQISGDVAAEIRKLKAGEGNELQVHGSGVLVQTLLEHDLIDTLYVWTFPLTLGKGTRLFDNGTKAASFKLVDCIAATTGVTISTYEPAGKLVTGSFAFAEPTEAELARRKRLKEELG